MAWFLGLLNRSDGRYGLPHFETAYVALGLGYPTSAEASCTTMWSDDFVEADYTGVCPPSSVIRLTFDHADFGEIKLNWYAGGLMPERPAQLPDDDMPGNVDGGSVFYGKKAFWLQIRRLVTQGSISTTAPRRKLQQRLYCVLKTTPRDTLPTLLTVFWTA